MKIQVLSDLHLEFYNDEDGDGEDGWELRDMFALPPLVDGTDVLCLLGDIGLSVQDRLHDYLLRCASRFSVVLYLIGNHEAYGEDDFQTCIRSIEATCDKAENLHFLNRTRVDLHGYRFVGCTMWTNVPDEHVNTMQRFVNDYRRVKWTAAPDLGTQTPAGGEGDCGDSGGDEGETPRTCSLRVHHTNRMHEQDIAWLEAEVAQARSDGLEKKVIILTHHSPSLWNCWHHPSDQMIHLDATNLDARLKDWSDEVLGFAFGHTHCSARLQHDSGVYLISNQKGYSPIGHHDKSFDPRFVWDTEAQFEVCEVDRDRQEQIHEYVDRDELKKKERGREAEKERGRERDNEVARERKRYGPKEDCSLQ